MKTAFPIVEVDSQFVKAFIPSLQETDNKVRRGKSLLLAGSSKYPGAGLLASRAALRAGSGYVVLAQPEMKQKSWETPEVIPRNLSEVSWESLSFDALLIGPGFGVNDYTALAIIRAKELNLERVVLDADALTVCAERNLFPLLATWVITPHTGELARCLQVTSEEIEKDRVHFVQLAQEKFNCVVLLKGAQSLVCGDGKIYRNHSGNSGLAKSGTGDVLAGIITSFRAQKLSALESTILGVFLHGACADFWLESGKDPLSLLASDVIELLPQVILKLRHGR